MASSFKVNSESIPLTSEPANSPIIFSAFLFSQLIGYFSDYLIYESDIKLLIIIILVIITLIFYIIASIITKAFKISDIKLKY